MVLAELVQDGPHPAEPAGGAVRAFTPTRPNKSLFRFAVQGAHWASDVLSWERH
jgi:hypothetical protein